MKTILKTHGGKYYLAPWIESHLPFRYWERPYLEPFCGGASLFFEKKRGEREWINDLHFPTIALWREIQRDALGFKERLRHVDYTVETFEKALRGVYETAINEYIIRRMSEGGRGRRFGWSERERRGQPGDVNAWEGAWRRIPEIGMRLQGVRITNLDFRDVIERAEKETIIYCDPPYLHETRVTPNVYDKEMDEGDHIELLELCLGRRDCTILISGYDSELYNRMLGGGKWKRRERRISNHASNRRTKDEKTEVLWIC